MAQPVDWADARLSDFETVKYTFEPHKPIKRKQYSWPVCQWCGLLYLKNDITNWCIRKGCNASYHPDYKRLKL